MTPASDAVSTGAARSVALKVASVVSISASAVSLEIRDAGAPFDPLTEGQRAELGADIDHARVGGLGVHLITQLTDTQSYRREDNQNVLTVTRSIATTTES